jgi:S-adenosylmethionine:tRNA ribosyltransferase-isomerase
MIARLGSPSTEFTVPADRTATEPAESRGVDRDQTRLLVGSAAGISHTSFSHIGSHLSAGDLLVVNNSATVAAELDGRSSRHGQLVLHIATRLEDLSYVVELRSAPDAAAPLLDAEADDTVTLAGGVTLRLMTPYPYERSAPGAAGNRLWRASVPDPVALVRLLERTGRPISYGYLRGRFPLSAYQTVFSAVPGSAEMPSAGRPFTARLVAALKSRGIGFAPITLHTGVSSQEAPEGPQGEWFDVPAATAALVNETRSNGGRVVAVGTTVTRALESSVAPDGSASAATGWTEHVVGPESPPRLIGGLVTGWHNPDASHLLLVEAIAGAALTQNAYDEAVREGYLWHEFGDSALLLAD